MARYMPALTDWFHYRNLDVSTVKELCKRWRPDLSAKVNKTGAHTAAWVHAAPSPATEVPSTTFSTMLRWCLGVPFAG